MLDHEIQTVLDSLNTHFPRVEEMTAQQARAAVAARRVPVTNFDAVERSEDFQIPGDGGPIPVRLYVPHSAEGHQLPVVVFLHGGGFVFCDIDSHDGFCRELSRGTNAIVLSVGYRRAPEHKAPTAAEDAWTALMWASENADRIGGDRERILVAGDSAGGNLAAVACMIATERGGPHVAGQILLYPVIDPSCSTSSFERFGTGFFNTAEAMRWYWQQYLPDWSLPIPEHHVAPLRAPDHSELPPAIVVTAGLDPLSDEGIYYAEMLSTAGVLVIHRRYPDLFHGFATILSLRAADSARELLWRDIAALISQAHLVRK
ncbi:alpha/beta hydrolase [Hoyosella altamirensis]|uniref:Acetyl esterase n=1 Tax=Hoyosella altamirensis TaxID=616997 RepID=A0A839RRS1_9ACTN|nr:alpha/beta hydrolase [Hoyosella altamirensis]MBB3039240.1 acetyl esterase [Hoyosella altamirensis]